LIGFGHSRVQSRVALVAGLLFCLPLSCAAQAFQFWPEIDTYVKLNDNVRFFFVAQQTRENKTGEDGEIGPNFDFYLKPLVRLKKIAGFELVSCN
jgi:hypothetical protein